VNKIERSRNTKQVHKTIDYMNVPAGKTIEYPLIRVDAKALRVNPDHLAYH
jgi:hypothetical protein